VRPEQLEEIVEGLMRLGYLEHDLQAILGGNLMRVARQVWKAPS
jgi:membrane dipeptidase